MVIIFIFLLALKLQILMKTRLNSSCDSTQRAIICKHIYFNGLYTQLSYK